MPPTPSRHFTPSVDQDQPCLFCPHTDLPMTFYSACTTTSTSRVAPLTQFHTPLPYCLHLPYVYIEALEPYKIDRVFILDCQARHLFPFYLSNGSYRPYGPFPDPAFRSSIFRGEILHKCHEYIGANGSQDVPLAV